MVTPGLVAALVAAHGSAGGLAAGVLASVRRTVRRGRAPSIDPRRGHPAGFQKFRDGAGKFLATARVSHPAALRDNLRSRAFVLPLFRIVVGRKRGASEGHGASHLFFVQLNWIHTNRRASGRSAAAGVSPSRTWHPLPRRGLAPRCLARGGFRSGFAVNRRKRQALAGIGNLELQTSIWNHLRR